MWGRAFQTGSEGTARAQARGPSVSQQLPPRQRGGAEGRGGQREPFRLSFWGDEIALGAFDLM